MSGRRRLDVARESVSLQIGAPFNPFGLFNGIFFPEVLLRAKGVSPGAKLTYGRLTRYAGQDGNCYPAVPTLASEIGFSVRQTQRYLTELEGIELIRRIPRISESGQTSNVYVFLWHQLFEDGVTKVTPEGVTDFTPEGVTDRSPKESQIEESQIEASALNTDIPTNYRRARSVQQRRRV